MGCHLAGACPFEVLDISPWAEATFRHFLHHPYAQRLPRKFKINFSGCVTDCGQAMFNDVGVIAVSRPLADGTVEPGFRVFVAGGLGANPHPAQALEEFTPREALLPTIEAVLRTFDHFGNRDNKLRARLKWVLDELGVDELRRRILRERNLLLASSSWPGGIPAIVEELGDAPAGLGTAAEPTPVGTPVTLRVKRDADPYTRWESSNVVVGVAKGTVSAIAYAKLGDITADQFRALAAIVRDFGVDVRVTNRQNLAFRGLSAEQLPDLYKRLDDIGMAEPGAELARDVVACPGADTCNLAVTQSRGLADDISRALEESGLADVGGIRINISGCTNSCGQHHIADIGFYGAERRAHGRPAPGYQMMLGGHVGNTEIEFGQRALRLPAKAAAEATVRVVCRFADERTAGEAFADWLARSGGAKALGCRAEGPGRLARSRGEARLLRRLRRDRPLRGGRRRRRVRGRLDEASESHPRRREDRQAASTSRSGSHLHAPDFGDAELAATQRALRGLRRPQAVIEWAVEQFHPFMCLAASMTDAVLIDLAVQVEPSIEVVFIDTRLPLPRDPRDRRSGPAPLRPQPAGPDRRRRNRSSCGRPTPPTAARRPRSSSSTGRWSASWPG